MYLPLKGDFSQLGPERAAGFLDLILELIAVYIEIYIGNTQTFPFRLAQLKFTDPIGRYCINLTAI